MWLVCVSSFLPRGIDRRVPSPCARREAFNGQPARLPLAFEQLEVLAAYPVAESALSLCVILAGLVNRANYLTSFVPLQKLLRS